MSQREAIEAIIVSPRPSPGLSGCGVIPRPSSTTRTRIEPSPASAVSATRPSSRPTNAWMIALVTASETASMRFSTVSSSAPWARAKSATPLRSSPTTTGSASTSRCHRGGATSCVNRIRAFRRRNLPGGPGIGQAAPSFDGDVIALQDRERELGAARTLLDDLDDGPRGLLVEGDAGIGKTAVWRSALREAEARGHLVLRCVAEQAEARLSFVGLADLIDGIADDHLSALPAPQREALEVALVRREGGERPPDPATVGVGLRSLLVRAARSAPVVVAIDDAQWLDAATARALAFAVRRLDGCPVGVLLTVRTPLAQPEPLGLERALGPERFTRVRLGPLGLDAVRRLIEAQLGYALPRPALLKIAQAADGNPLFALEIARALGPAPALEAGAPLPVPDSLRELVAGRVAGLDPHARRALLVAAALSHPTVELVEQASSPHGLVAAEESGLLCVEGDRLVFAHPLYASAVYGAAASGRRRALHRRLAAQVADPEERVRHLALAAARPDERVARGSRPPPRRPARAARGRARASCSSRRDR